MKSYILLSLFLLSAFIKASAQDDSNILPDFTPPSPQAEAITKFAGSPINEHLGLANASIPIHTYSAGKIQVPISLNYTGAGVKVDELASWTGIKWTLSAGGVITRTVHDAPDEYASTRYFYEDILNMNLYDNSQDAGELNVIYTTNTTVQWDMKPDIFNFSFAGYSGSFYLDRDMVPRIVKKDSELEILIDDNGLGNSNQFSLYHYRKFIIITPDGTKYFFGGDDATEFSKLTYGTHETITNNAPTAFYLYKIEHPIQGTVFLEYDTSGTVIINQSESYSFTKLSLEEDDAVNFSERVCFTYGNNQQDGEIVEPPLPSGNPYIPFRIKNETYGMKYLYRIYSPDTDQSVFFYSSVSSNSQDNNYNRVLDKIEIKNGSDVFSTIDLSYQSNPSRFFLTEVAFNENLSDNENAPLGRKNQVYKLEYNPGLPPRFSKSQDHLGYYNGKSNMTLLPKTDVSEFSIFDEYGADRSTDFQFAKCGSLKRIYYPTGGFTEFEYEAFKEKTFEKKIGNLAVFRGNYHNFLTHLQDTYSELGPPMVENGPNNEVIVINGEGCLYSQTLRVHCYLEADQPTEHDDKVWVRVTNTDTGAIQEKYFVMDTRLKDVMGVEYNNKTYVTFNFPIQSGQHYLIRLSVDNPNNGLNEPMMATASFSIKNGIKLIDAPGVRVKRTSDYSEEAGTPFNVKRYFYCKKEDLLKPATEAVPFEFEPNYIDYFTVIYRCQAQSSWNPDGPESVPMHFKPVPWYYKTLKSSPDNLHENIDRVYRNVVISYGGDNFENGGVEKQFFFEKNDFLDHFKMADTEIGYDGFTVYVRGEFFKDDKISYSGNANDFLNGTLIKETTLVKKSAELHKIVEKSFDYGRLINNAVAGITGGKAYVHYQYPYTGYSNFQLGEYGIFSKSVFLSSTTTKEYIETVPLSAFISNVQNPPGGWSPFADYDNDGIPNFLDQEGGVEDVETIESNYAKVTTTTSYEYDSFVGQPTKITTTDSEGKTIEQRNYYVDTASQNLLPGDALPASPNSYLTGYNTLMENHMLSNVIQSETYSNGDLTSRKRTLYRDFPENPGDVQLDVFPSIIQYAKDESQPLEDRVIFHEYSGTGNPTVVSLKDGPKTKYFYNSRNQVVLKIENYDDNGFVPGPEITADYDGSTIPEGQMPCDIQQSYPDSFVTRFIYDHFGNLIQIRDKNCQKTTFVYDARHQLKYIKDNFGNIRKENDVNYFRY